MDTAFALLGGLFALFGVALLVVLCVSSMFADGAIAKAEQRRALAERRTLDGYSAGRDWAAATVRRELAYTIEERKKQETAGNIEVAASCRLCEQRLRLLLAKLGDEPPPML